MELLEIAKKRHSVRKYTKKEIEQEKLNKILEAAHVIFTLLSCHIYETVYLVSYKYLVISTLYFSFKKVNFFL